MGRNQLKIKDLELKGLMMMRRLVFAMMVMFMALFSQAAVYTWSQYQLNFEVPDGGFVTYNSNTRFEIFE